MAEVIFSLLRKIEESPVLARLKLSPGRFFVVSVHREENVDSTERLTELLLSLNLIAKTYRQPVIVSTHPRTRMRLETLRQERLDLALDTSIQFLKPFGFLDYAMLQQQAFCVLSDSGSLTEDASLLNFPAVTIREAHERPEGMDVATLVMSGLSGERIMQAIEIVTAHHSREKRSIAVVPDYEVDCVSNKIVRIILSYVDYVNRTIWHKKAQSNIESTQQLS